MEKQTKSIFDLLQPELLTVEELSEILHTRCISKHLSESNKEELVEIYKRVVFPLPQRIFKSDTHRGKMLSDKQKRKKITIESPSFDTFQEGRKQRISTPNDESSKSRIKPPVDSSNLKRKVIKLSSGRRPSEDLDKVIINDKTKVSSTSEKKETDDNINGNKHKKICIDFSESTTPNVSKRLSSEEEGTTLKKKHKRIVI